MASETTAEKVESILLQVRKAGVPQTRTDWLNVLKCLIRCTDEVLATLRDRCREFGCGWMHSTLAAITNALEKKQATRVQGIVVFPDPSALKLIVPDAYRT